MTTSLSKFTPGQGVWEAFAYFNHFGSPVWRIRRAEVVLAPDGKSHLLRFDDGRVEAYWPSPSLKAFPHHVEAVAHCVSVFHRLRRDIEDAVDDLMALNEDHPGGPARSGITTAGTAPPEVAK